MIKKFGDDDLTEEAISRLKEISYILEDDGLVVEYNRLMKYSSSNCLFNVIVRKGSRFQDNFKKSDTWEEYVSRSKQILSSIGLVMSTSGSARDRSGNMYGGSSIYLNVGIMSPRQKRRLFKQ